MARFEFAVDMGTSSTSLHRSGAGAVLREPSVLALSSGRREKLLAVGGSARKLVGRTPTGVAVHFPLSAGGVQNFPLAARMLEEFMRKVLPGGSLRTRFKLLLLAPCGSSPEDKQTLSRLCYDAGARQAVVIDAPCATLYGLSDPFGETEPAMIVDIGGGKTDISVVTRRGMVAGCSVAIGGNNLDAALLSLLEEKYSLRTGVLSAERLRIQVGSLHPADRAEAEVSGADCQSGAPSSVAFGSKALYPELSRHYGAIFASAAALLGELPAEGAADIRRRGAYLTGGASQVPGIAKAFEGATGIKANLAEDPLLCTVNGGGRLLAQPKLLEPLLGQ